MPNETLQKLFQEYAEYHRHPMNRLTHKIAIPLIVFQIIAMLNWVTLGTIDGTPLTLAILAYVLVIGWYATLDPLLASIMAVLYGACLWLADVTPVWVVIACAVVGWTIQLLGHVVWEKRSPAFLTNMLQALVGPLFFVAKGLGRH